MRGKKSMRWYDMVSWKTGDGRRGRGHVEQDIISQSIVSMPKIRNTYVLRLTVLLTVLLISPHSLEPGGTAIRLSAHSLSQAAGGEEANYPMSSWEKEDLWS